VTQQLQESVTESAQEKCTEKRKFTKIMKIIILLIYMENSATTTSASADSGEKLYNEATSAGLKPSNSWAVSDGFTTVTYKKKPAPESVPVNTIKHRRQPLIGVRN
jgi:hypothetical protein